MRDIAKQLLGWAEGGERFALASILAVRGSAPRGPGAAMAVSAGGAVLGSLSGGCIEGSVYDAALRTLETDEPVRHSYDYDPENPFAVGLSCGGEIDVHVQPVDPRRDAALLSALRATLDEEPVALARVLASGTSIACWPDRREGGTGDQDLDERVALQARAMLEQNTTGVRQVCQPATEGGSLDHVLFVESWNSPPKMLIFGAIDYAAALARMGKFLGYHVTVCDARAVFATRQRFPDADEVVSRWPHEYLAGCEVDERTVVCVLTHDVKFDIPVLRQALRGKAAYIGALGSRHTHADRLERLRAAGLNDGEIARLRAPIGLDLRASTPEETAVSIAAEILAVRTQASTLPLAHTEGPIHA